MQTEEINEHLRPISAAYHAAVRDIVDEALREYPDDYDARSDFIAESVDGSEWVIYTYRAQLVMVLSDNDGAYVDDFGKDGALDDDGVKWSALAYAAMYADCLDYLDAIKG